MSNEQKSNSNKTWRLIALVFVLGVLPLGSWLYLRGGLEWRKDALAELGDFGKIRAANIIYPNGTKEDQLKESICVIHYFGANPELTEDNKRIIETFKRLYDQFGTLSTGMPRPFFKLVLIYEGGSVEFRSEVQKIPTIDYATWVVTGGLNSWGTILNNGYEKFRVEKKAKQYDRVFALADATGQLKCFYNALDEKQLNRLVQQIALMLPPE
jgi:hypothetical protein